MLDAQGTAKKFAGLAGEELIEVKAGLKHGQFIPWVEKHCAFSQQLARKYVQVARAKSLTRERFDVCTSIREVLAPGKTPKEPKRETRAATLNDLRKVERLRALRDGPAATEGERENAQRASRFFLLAFKSYSRKVEER